MRHVVALILFLPSFAAAESWQSLVRQLCPSRGVPTVVAETIIRHESRGNPYALNVRGKSHFSPSHAEAATRLHEALRTTDNVDIGIMQLNWRTWGKVLQVNPILLLDPELNIRLGCTLLGAYITQEGSIVRGMLRYHSATPWRQAQYAQRLYATLAQR